MKQLYRTEMEVYRLSFEKESFLKEGNGFLPISIRRFQDGKAEERHTYGKQSHEPSLTIK